jgi:hypothetical protein
MADVSVITLVASRLDTLLTQRLGSRAPEPDAMAGTDLGPAEEATLALRAAAAGTVEELETIAETLDALAATAALDTADRFVLALLTLANVDDRIGRAIGLLHDDASRTRPSVGLTARVLEPLVEWLPAFDAASPDGALVQRGIVEHTGAYGDAGAPMANRELILQPRVLAVLLNGGPLSAVEPRLRCAFTIEHDNGDGTVHAASLFGPVRADSDSLLDRVARLHLPGRAVGLLAVGNDLDAALDLARSFTRRQRLRVLRVDLAAALALGESPESLVRLVRRESIVLHALPVWTGLPQRELLAEPQLARRLVQLFMAAPTPLVIHAEQLWTPPSDLPLTLVHHAVPGPSFEQRVALWQQEDGRTRPASPETAQQLATLFVLPPLGVAAARHDAVASLHVLGGEYPDQLQRAAHRQAAAGLVRFATKITPRAGWDDLVVPPTVLRQLRDMEWRVANRLPVMERSGFRGRRGFLALFVGGSGTGKTLAAEVIAASKGFDLFKVDVASLVSKYIGETEKNLEDVFHAAEATHAILFFDEADAVFGRRSEVRDSHDQYANQQVNYLLQRVEAYDGIIILATNMRQNMDEAFMRRLDLVVELPFPDDDARADIWRRTFPTGVKLADDVDIGTLAGTFRLTGGSIRNAAIDAMFRAARRTGVGGGIVVEREDLLLAIGREYQKLGRPVTRAEFGGAYEDVLDTLFTAAGGVHA